MGSPGAVGVAWLLLASRPPACHRTHPALAVPCPLIYLLQDLVSEGMLALERAARRYRPQPGRDASFGTFAAATILNVSEGAERAERGASCAAAAATAAATNPAGAVLERSNSFSRGQSGGQPCGEPAHHNATLLSGREGWHSHWLVPMPNSPCLFLSAGHVACAAHSVAGRTPACAPLPR